MDKTKYLLQKDWLRYAESAKKSAAGWLKAAKDWTKEKSYGWSKSECEREAEAYTKTYNEMMERSKAAPVRIVIYYVDGRTEVIE